ncbi:MAG: UDP-GlcNAc:undecaprenyl-phosphate GlcNAc-1-phosphate transferase [Ulvibacter sp.]|jgi:UDP-GlcNAc:undecaprenyl-phosphate GlcNAc-1-phosphate transferase
MSPQFENLDNPITHMYIIGSLLTAFGIAFFIIPSIIQIALEKNLCDQPNQRSSHKKRTPSLGGLAVFIALIFSIFFWTTEISFLIKYLLCGSLIVTAIGLKDDIITLSPSRKIIGQMVAIFMLIHFADLRIDSFFGLFGINEIPTILSYSFTILFMLTIINGFNLIDGINGLSASAALIAASFFGTWFYWIGLVEEALIAFALIGSLLAFLFYNITPAKIFLGDTGSLLIGLVVAILCVQFWGHQSSGSEITVFNSTPIVACSVVILPLFDTVRVFFIRIAKRRSPFHPDRSHLHHMLIDMGLSHMRATGVLIGVNLFFIITACLLQGIMVEIQMLLLLGFAIGFSVLIYQFKKNYDSDMAKRLLADEYGESEKGPIGRKRWANPLPRKQKIRL